MENNKGHDDKLASARELIRNNPGMSVRSVNSQLRSTFGKGIRDSELYQAKRDVFKESPSLIPEKNLNSHYITSLFGKDTAKRFDRLVSSRHIQPAQAVGISLRPEASRATRITEAKKLIQANPGMDKTAINDKLRSTFGVGIRHSDILHVKRDVFKEAPKLIPAKNLNARYVEKIFGSLEGKRFSKLVTSSIWTKKESLSLSKLPLSQITYIEDLTKNREALITQMQLLKQLEGWSKERYTQELDNAITNEYKMRGWLNKQGDLEIFRMVDDFRQSKIDEGKDPSPGKGKQVIQNPDGSLRFLKNKGNKAAQNARYRKLHPDAIREQRQNYKQRQRNKANNN
jgi:hypothetical protein